MLSIQEKTLENLYWYKKNLNSEISIFGVIAAVNGSKSITSVKHKLFPSAPLIFTQPDSEYQIAIQGSLAAYDLATRTPIWDRRAFFETPHIEDYWQLFYFGIVFVMTLYNLVIYVLSKEKAYLLYSIFVGSSLLMFLCLSGWAFQYLWPNTTAFNQRMVYLGMTGLFIFAGWFSIAF